jgi:hypothetical protein
LNSELFEAVIIEIDSGKHRPFSDAEETARGGSFMREGLTVIIVSP